MSESDGAGVLRIPEMYKTDAILWLYLVFLSGVRCTLRTRSRETGNQEACLAVPDNPPESLPCVSLVAFGGWDPRLLFWDILPSSAFRPPVVYSFYVPLSLLHMSSGSQSASDAVVPKFDMHIYPSVMTLDKVKNLVAEYAIPLDLHPCVPPSGLTMNRLPVDKIDRRAILDAMPWRHQDSSVADPPPTGIRAEDIRRLCENVIDLRPVHLAMLYAVGLTTIWKHVGHHPVFKDVVTSMSQFLKFPMAGGVRVVKGTTLAANEVIPQHTTPPLPSGSQIPEKSDHQKVVEVENERVLAAKRKAQVAKDRAAGKRAAAEGASQQTKRKKTTPLSFALSDSKADESNRSGSGTHHSASPLNTIIPNEGELATSLILEPVDQTEEDTDQPLDNSNPSDEGTHPVRSEPGPTHASGSTGHKVSSTSGGSYRLAFPARHPGGDDAAPAGGMRALQRSWFELGRGALAQIDMLQRYKVLNEDYGELFESHRSCQYVHLGCVGKEAGLTKKLVAVEKARDGLLDRDREREERIKQLEADLASKTSSFAEAEGVVGTLKGDLERLTLDLSYAEIVRHNYVHQLLPTVVQRLLSNGEYKKSLTDVFNLAIVAGWSEGVKATCSEEEA
ncbi:hypothetical protein Tco_1055194 [Tanacetum coccineum]|uniref:Uncharacterized protein n=1 Tax=Tanacetum coccineum TaxID=301880 RepID=A0ABQ5GYX8_9ASTR